MAKIIPATGRLHCWFLFFFLFNSFTSGFFRRVSAQLQLNCENPQTASSCSTSKNWANLEGQALKVFGFPCLKMIFYPQPPSTVFPAPSICFSHPSLCLQQLLLCFWLSFLTQCYLPPLFKQKSNFGGKIYSLQSPVLYPQKKTRGYPRAALSTTGFWALSNYLMTGRG